MNPTISLVCVVLAIVMFALAGIGTPGKSWRDFGFMFLSIAWLFK